VGHVGDPELVRASRAELTLDEVVSDADAGDADRGPAAFARTMPEIFASRINRSTRLRPTRMPWAMASSAWMRGEP
jgi:hypothetical protein